MRFPTFSLTSLALCMALGSHSVNAYDSFFDKPSIDKLSFTPSWSGLYFDSDRNFDDANILSLGVGYQVIPNLDLELTLGTSVNKIDSVIGELDYWQWRFDALYSFKPAADIIPYVVLGGGQHMLEQNDISESENFFNFGVGAKTYITPNISLRGDVRQLRNLDEINSQEFADIAFQLGISYSFGENNSGVEPLVQKYWESRKSDEVKDDSVAEPQEEYVAKTTVTIEDETLVTEGASYDDFVMQGEAVAVSEENEEDLYGNEVASADSGDDDFDGIPNHSDQCNDTSMGAKIDDAGCYITLDEDKVMTLNITYDPNSARVPQEFLEDIAEIAEYMMLYPTTHVVIEGHTDNIGDENYNLRLSEKRAIVAGIILAEKFGIERKRISYLGYGESEPIFSNETEEGRDKNRRVVALITSNYPY